VSRAAARLRDGAEHRLYARNYVAGYSFSEQAVICGKSAAKIDCNLWYALLTLFCINGSPIVFQPGLAAKSS
jgi:hypothetical protein